MKNNLDNNKLDGNLVLSAIVLLTLCVVPHGIHIYPVIIACFLFFSLWRLLAIRFKLMMVNRWLLYTFAAAGFSISAWHYGPPLGRDPGVAFLIVMLGLKLLETRTRRDIRIVLLLGYFVIITHFLYAGSMSLAVPMALLLFGLTWLMIQMGHVQPVGNRRSDIKLAGKLFMQALPFAIILFFLFPRIAGSLWLFQSESGSAGLNDSLSMGTISELVQSDNVAFSVRFKDGVIPPKPQRYWRGNVLWQTDGRVWTRGQSFQGARPSLTPLSGQYNYEVRLQPSYQKWLYTLDAPIAIPSNANIDSDFHVYVDREIDRQFVYDATSYTGYHSLSISDEQRDSALTLPQSVTSDRLKQLVNDLKSRSTNPAEYVNRVLAYFNEKPFYYTLQPPLLTSDRPVEEFLFDSRRGFCGHYASSFTTLMRAAEIPARVVIGYLGGEFNPRSELLVVRQSDAHAWSEVWLEGKGWQRIDPTAAVAPGRIENPIDFGLTSAAGGLVRFSPRVTSFLDTFVREARWMLDSTRSNWNRWFVGFDHQRQQSLLRIFSLDGLSLRTLAMFSFLVALGVLTAIAFISYSGEAKPTDPVLGLYRKFCDKLAKAGIVRSANEGPMDFLGRTVEQLPQHEQALRSITDQYISLRYGDNPPPDLLKIFRRSVTRFKSLR